MKGRGAASPSRWSRLTAIGAAVALAVLCGGVPAASAAKPSSKSRYSLARGCWSLVPATTGEPVPIASKQRLQATDLGSYLLFGTANDFLSASGASVVRDDQPSPGADWVIEKAGKRKFTLSPKSSPNRLLAASGGGLATVPRADAGRASRFRFLRATGCAAFPEAQLNVKGKAAKRKPRYGEVRGLFDGHMHWMTFEYGGGNFHCGRPWHRYGIPSALPDCAETEGPMGSAAPIQNFFNYGSPVAPHDTTGWPKLTEWRRDNLTYEGTYYRWLQRTWKAGQRLIAMPINENRELCNFAPQPHRNPCDEMNTVRLGIKDMYEMQDYVDAQAGGPGRGFFRIVRNPFQARRVINKGKMAVVLELEISELFNCRGAIPSSCSRDIVDSNLEELYEMGVRSSLLLNKFDNPLTGVRFDSGPVGVVLNALNRNSYGSFWDAETCEGPETDNTIQGVLPGDPFLLGLLAQLGVGGGTLPAYPPPPHCNTRGLTDLGRYTVRKMMDMGMIINPDHMGQKAVDETLTIAESRGYSGVISPHGWMDPRNWPRIFQLGGMAFPGAGDSEGFVEAWNAYRPKGTPHYFGWGYGADLGGLATQGAPADPGSPNAVTYPFKSLDGRRTINRQRTGERVFDYAEEGVAHYGLYADWYEELRKTGGRPIVRDMLHGPEAYLQMWERAVGIRAARCKGTLRDFTRQGLGMLRLGLRTKKLLRKAGQPVRRTRAWTYCVRGKRKSAQTAVMTRAGKVGLVASSVPGQAAFGIAPGDDADQLGAAAKALNGTVFTRKLGNRKAAYVVRGGVVRTVAIARAATSNATLRAYLKKVPAKIARRPREVISQSSSKIAPADAEPLATQRDGAQFPMYCGIVPDATRQ